MAQTQTDDKASLVRCVPCLPLSDRQGHDEKASPILEHGATGKADAYAAEGHAAEGFNLAPIDARAEKRLVWKLDLMVLPPLMLIVRRTPARISLTPAVPLQLHRPLEHRQRPRGRPRTRLWHHARPGKCRSDRALSLTLLQYNSSLTIYYAVYGLANLPACVRAAVEQR